MPRIVSIEDRVTITTLRKDIDLLRQQMAIQTENVVQSRARLKFISDRHDELMTRLVAILRRYDEQAV